ncbi:MAG TPA: hypothetical protein VFC19_25350 [Candidatus Limnocylindrales bacterium]|nr:hypothetical protein [Candidatus Limnocylindrales bacterium]
MIAKEVKRRTDKVYREMSEVIVNEGPVSAVAMGVQDVNVTLAHHAAWTEERFEGVEERLGGLELGQQAIREDIAGLTVKVDGLDTKVTSLDTKVTGIASRVGSLEIVQIGMLADMREWKDQIRGDINKLAVRMDKVISFAIKDELKLAEILKEDNES